MIVNKDGTYVLKQNSDMESLGLQGYLERVNKDNLYGNHVTHNFYVKPTSLLGRASNNEVREVMLRQSSKILKLTMFYLNGYWYAYKDGEGDYVLKEITP